MHCLNVTSSKGQFHVLNSYTEPTQSRSASAFITRTNSRAASQILKEKIPGGLPGVCNISEFHTGVSETNKQPEHQPKQQEVSLVLKSVWYTSGPVRAVYKQPSAVKTKWELFFKPLRRTLSSYLSPLFHLNCREASVIQGLQWCQSWCGHVTYQSNSK